MAEFMQLDKAAASVGKSEVTLRRLIKAGKIPFQKEKTLTGFVYLVNPDQVRAYYQVREGTIYADEAQDIFQGDEESAEAAATAPAQPRPPRQATGQSSVRVPIVGESGDLYEYWQKKSDLYEVRYNDEVVKHSHTREELGVWRGRAEQSQTMLVKLLPSPSDVEVTQGSGSVRQESEKPRKEEGSLLSALVITALVVLLVVAIGAIVYLKLFMK